MNIKIMATLIVCLFYSTPLSADYSSLDKTLEDYTPPEYYTNSLKLKPERKDFVKEQNKTINNVFSRIKDLKLIYEKKISNDHDIFFLSGIDLETIKRFADISSDQKALKKIVNKNLKLDEIEIIAGLRNPAVLAAQKKIKAELESFNQVMALDEDLKQYSAFIEGINNKIGPLNMKESIKQKYPFPGLTSLKARVIHSQVEVLVEKMNIARKNVITEVRKAYWNIVFIEQSIGITSETIEAFNRLKEVATVLYKSGKTSFQDIIKINIKLEVLKEDLVTLLSKKKNIEIRLRKLINLPANTRIGKFVFYNPYKKIPITDDLYPLALQNRQELKVIRHQINKIQTMIEMAESMIQEPFTLGLSIYEDEAVNTIGTRAGKPSFKEKTMASMKNSSPLKPWYGIDSPWLGQTKQNLLSLEQTLVEQENATDRMVRNAWFEVDKNKREIDLYKKRILPLSKSALDVTTREYEAGSIPFSQAIDSYTYWLKVKLTLSKKQTDLGISTANLEKIIGNSF